MPRTYIPDNSGLKVEEIEHGVRLCQPVEQPTGIQKAIDLVLLDDRPALTVQHVLQNVGSWPVELAPWALTQVALGGVAVLPVQAPMPSQFLPTQRLTLWPYTRLRDCRLRPDDDFVVVVSGRSAKQPFKIGLFCHAGWIGYLLRDATAAAGRRAGAPGAFPCTARLRRRRQSDTCRRRRFLRHKRA